VLPPLAVRVRVVAVPLQIVVMLDDKLVGAVSALPTVTKALFDVTEHAPPLLITTVYVVFAFNAPVV
jgi:hypothetical protein